MNKIAVVHLDKIADTDLLLARVKKLRELRLLSLQTDPGSFISRYEDEVDKPTEFWIDRQLEPEAEHFVAQIEDASKGRTEDDNTAKFVAFLVLVKRDHWPLGASHSDPTVSNDSATAEDAMPTCSMEAMYVEPSFRRQGVSGQLMRAMMHWIEREARRAQVHKVKILTTVAEGNETAKDAYLKKGFNLISCTTIQDKAGNPKEVSMLECILDCTDNEV